MIKINIISNNKVWYRYIKNPTYFIQKRVDNFNKRFKKYQKKTIFCTILLSGENEIKKLNKKYRKKNKNIFKIEFNKLWIHGLTHLFGYDHCKDQDFYQMNKIEKKFLSYLN